MEPSKKIAELCRKYGIPPEFGARLRPLLERANESPPEKRQRLLDLVERSFAEEARRLRRLLSPQDLAPEDFGLIKTVAGVLHAWEPPVWLRLWEEAQRRGLVRQGRVGAAESLVFVVADLVEILETIYLQGPFAHR